jgi:hypothetical protein
MGVEIILD